MSSIIKENQYFDNEMEFCAVTSASLRKEIEEVFLRNRISYFVKFEEASLLARIIQKRPRNTYIFRINAGDMARAERLVDGMEGVRILNDAPEEDWSPKSKLERRRREAENAAAQDADSAADEKADTGAEDAEGYGNDAEATEETGAEEGRQ